MSHHLAVYWDFENVHASLYDSENGVGVYRKSQYVKQPALVSVDALMGFILPRGRVAVNRAYANWTWLFAYSNDFQNHAIDLIQLFPRGAHAKNGADIRMAVDIIEDVNAYPHIQTVVIIGGDSDYIAVAQKLRQKGKEVIGIGVQGTTNRFWIKACNEFKYYANLVKKANPEAPVSRSKLAPEPEMAEARQLLEQALTRVMALKSEPFARMSALKSTMLQLDPAFDEESYGFGNFADFVAACQDLVSIAQGPHEKHVSLKAHRPVPASPLENPGSPLESYRKILRQQQIKLLPGDRFARMCQAVSAAAADGLFTSWDDFNTRVKACLETPSGFALEDRDLTRLKQLLLKFKVFLLGDNSILLQPEFLSFDALLTHVFRQVVSRLLSQPELRWDARLVSQLLYGDEEHMDIVNKWFEEANEIRGDDVS